MRWVYKKKGKKKGKRKEKEKDPQGQSRTRRGLRDSNITRFLLIYPLAIASVSAPSDIYGYFEPTISRNRSHCFIIWSRKWFRGELNIAQARKMIVARKVSIPAVAMCRGTMYGIYLAAGVSMD